jgi:hypothetical protein
LTELALPLGVPGETEEVQLVALGALQGLAALQPGDLRTRIASLLRAPARPDVQKAALKALALRGACSR